MLICNTRGSQHCRLEVDRFYAGVAIRINKAQWRQKTRADVTGWLLNRWTNGADLLGRSSYDLCEQHRQRKNGPSYYAVQDIAILAEALFRVFLAFHNFLTAGQIFKCPPPN